MRMTYEPGADVFVLAPTGMGKVCSYLCFAYSLCNLTLFQSLCFQVPAIADKVRALSRDMARVFTLRSTESLL
jgi:hypothetical protein